MPSHIATGCNAAIGHEKRLDPLAQISGLWTVRPCYVPSCCARSTMFAETTPNSPGLALSQLSKTVATMAHVEARRERAMRETWDGGKLNICRTRSGSRHNV